MNKNKREPKKALLLSLIMPGLGQVYNGELSKGISLFLSFAFAIPVFSWLATHGPNACLWLLVLSGVICGLAVAVFSYLDAYKRAKAIGVSYEPGPANRIHVYLSLLFFGYFFVLNQLVTYTRTHLIEAYQVPSTSMSPGLEKGDHFFVDKDVNSPGAKRKIRRGDIATFVYPNDRTSVYVKRVIGLPGDTVEINGIEVKVNGKSLSAGEPASERDRQIVSERAESGETYPVAWKANPETPRAPFTVKVPDGQVFVLGDNRDESYDSRKFGTLPLTDIIGIAKQVWYSASSAGLRLGKWVDVNTR